MEIRRMLPGCEAAESKFAHQARVTTHEYPDLAKICRHLEALVAATFAVPLGELRAPTRRRPEVAFARQCAIYLAHISFGLSYRQVGRLFGRDHTTAAHACRLIEHSRDEKGLDGVLNALESACVSFAASRTTDDVVHA